MKSVPSGFAGKRCTMLALGLRSRCRARFVSTLRGARPSLADCGEHRLRNLLAPGAGAQRDGGDAGHAPAAAAALSRGGRIARAARAAGEVEEVQIAALLHGVGDVLGPEAGFARPADGGAASRQERATRGARFLHALGLAQRIA